MQGKPSVDLAPQKKVIRHGGIAYIYGQWQRDLIKKWGIKHNMKLIISGNIEKEATSEPYYSVRRK